jgi:hypothetical protein
MVRVFFLLFTGELLVPTSNTRSIADFVGRKDAGRPAQELRVVGQFENASA